MCRGREVLVRSISANARPTIQLPNTPTTVKTRVNLAACQNPLAVRTVNEVLEADEIRRPR